MIFYKAGVGSLTASLFSEENGSMFSVISKNTDHGLLTLHTYQTTNDTSGYIFASPLFCRILPVR